MSEMERALKHRGRPEARYRPLIVAAFVIIIIILGVGLYLVYQDAAVLSRQINNDFNQQQLMLARQATIQIAGNLRDIRTELERFSRYQLRLTSRADTLDAVSLMVDYASQRGVHELGVIDQSGQVSIYYALGREHTPDSTMIRRIRTLTSNGPVVITEPTSIKGGLVSRTVTGLLCVPASSKADAKILYVRLDVTELVRQSAESLRSGRTGAAWVVDGHGTFLYHERDEFVARNAFTVRSEYHRDIDFTAINDIMRQSMLAGEQGTGVYTTARAGSSKPVEKLVAWTKVDSELLPAENTWTVAVSAPVNEVAESVRAATTRHIVAEAAMITSMFLLGLLALFYERRISRTLKRRVAEQETYLSTILQDSVDAIILISPDNRVLVWNRGAEMIFGYTAKEMLGRSFHPIVPPDVDAEDELKRIEKEVASRGYVRNYRGQRMTKDGKRITIDLSRTAVYGPNGEMLGSVAIIRDVTEEMEMEQRLYNTEKLASIGTLAAGVAHEINNPLAIILGFTDLLKEKFKEGSPEMEDLGIIEQNAENAKKTVENLLGFARVQEGRTETMDVVESLQTVMNVVTSTKIEQNLELVTDIPDRLPPIRADAREFQQVIFNLINNALAAMKSRSHGVLKVSAWVESKRVCVRVTDNGPGIPDQIKGRIFDPFFTTKKVGEGTGLGLSLSYGIAKKYGGSIDFYSHSAEDNPDDPSGTSFTVAIPVAETDGSESETGS